MYCNFRNTFFIVKTARKIKRKNGKGRERERKIKKRERKIKKREYID